MQARTLGKYRLLELLGRGGMAEVWRAAIEGPGGFLRTLVVKRILPENLDSPQFLQMFMAEAQLSARLSHSNIVTVFEFGECDGEYFLAMEYLRGRDLVSVMRALVRRGVPPAGLGAYVVREVARALVYAHELTDDDGTPLGLIHRDVTPSNLMLGFDGSVKLVDFGIAKALGAPLDFENKSKTGALKGKLGYLAPEQLAGGEVDHRADIFAAGIVLHEALTGRRLFHSATPGETFEKIRRLDVPPPSTLNPGVPPALDAICARALERSVSKRYQSCQPLVHDLDDVIHELRWGAQELVGLLRELFPPTQRGGRESSAQPLTREEATLLNAEGGAPTSVGRRGAGATSDGESDGSGVELGSRDVMEIHSLASPGAVAADRSRAGDSGGGRALRTDRIRSRIGRWEAVGLGALLVAAVSGVVVGRHIVTRRGPARSAPGETLATPRGAGVSGAVLVAARVDAGLASTRDAASPSSSGATSAATAVADRAPRARRIHVVSNPAGARVFVGAEPSARGLAPLWIPLPAGTDRLALRLRLRGFRDEVRDVDCAADECAFTAELAPAPRAPARRSTARSGHDLVGGAIVDPFGSDPQ